MNTFAGWVSTLTAFITLTFTMVSTLTPSCYASFPSPCYVLEEALLRRNLRTIQRVALEAGVEIILALKAYALWRTFPIFREYIGQTTASSPWEAQLSLEAFGSRTHTYSPAYEDDTFPVILHCSDHITFNSLSQYAHFAPMVQAYNAAHRAERPAISMGLRVNPEYSEIKTDLYNPTAPGSRFGMLADELPASLPDGLEGLHIHCHCEDSSYTFARTLAHIEQHFSRWFDQLQWINFGGGHLMTRADYDRTHLIGLLTAFKQRYPHLRVYLEPGSAFGWQTGELLAKVVDVVSHRGILTAVLNVSFACHMPDCLEMPYQPEVRGAHAVSDDVAKAAATTCGHTPEGYVYRLGGNSCLSGDYIGAWVFPAPLTVGQTLVFEDMLHYTTVKTHTFNGIAHPAIALLKENGEASVLRQFSYEDYKYRMD